MTGTATAPEAGEQSPAISYEGIAILGSHPVTVMMAPFDDPAWLIYACSPHNFEKRQLPRFDQWFEVHPTLSDKTRAYPYLKFLETVPCVWMQDKQSLPFFPGGREYPVKEMKGEGRWFKGADGKQHFELTKLGKFSHMHFTSSIAYMMAKGIVDIEAMPDFKPDFSKKLGLYGIMQASETEYLYQRQGIQYFIDQCFRRGIKFVAPDVSSLADPMPDTW